MDHSTEVDNEWFPLDPGTQFTWEGYATDEGERVSRKASSRSLSITLMDSGCRQVSGPGHGLRKAVRLAAVASLFLLTASACGGGAPPEEAARNGTPSDTATGGEARPSAISANDFDTVSFDRSTVIDNRWFPVEPGKRFVYVGFVNDGNRRVHHRVVLTVTDLTKMIDGVRTVVIWDRDYTAGELVEGELAFFAQDDEGNVWLLGEYPEEYEEGKFVGAPDTWIAGLARAEAGILMRADPALGTPGYLQGWAPEIEFKDRAKVHEVGLRNCVPFDCFQDAVLTREWNPDEPGAFQLKYYAPGVGNIRVGFAGPNEKEHETLVLQDVVDLDPDALAEVREDALRIEERAYEVSKDLYGRTAPAEHALGE